MLQQQEKSDYHFEILIQLCTNYLYFPRLDSVKISLPNVQTLLRQFTALKNIDHKTKQFLEREKITHTKKKGEKNEPSHLIVLTHLGLGKSFKYGYIFLPHRQYCQTYSQTPEKTVKFLFSITNKEKQATGIDFTTFQT